MTATLLLAALFTCQDPGPAVPPADAGRLDIVLLRNGEQIEGRIVVEMDGYVEIALPRGGTVGFGRGQVDQVRRGAGAAERLTARWAPAPADEWFVLHDAHGLAVGWLHTTLQVGSDGGVRLGEEWEFVAGTVRTAVSLVEHASADLQPGACYYRERVSEAGERHLREERIVDARFENGRLLVRQLSLAGRTERSREVPADTLFPLLAQLRARSGGPGDRTELVFDPGTSELLRRTFEEARPRRVMLDGAERDVVEVATNGIRGRNTEWLDASHRTLRREINGPSLVAVPSTPEAAQRATGGSVRYPGAMVLEPGRRFGLWLPNPSWGAADSEPVAGQVHLRHAVHDATVTLVVIDHLDQGAALATAADALERWLLLLHPGMRIENRADTKVRGCAAVRIDTRSRGKDARCGTVHVIEHRAGFLALTCLWPAERSLELGPDLDFLVRAVELDAEAIEPPLQGPMKKRADDRRPEPVKSRSLRALRTR